MTHYMKRYLTGMIVLIFAAFAVCCQGTAQKWWPPALGFHKKSPQAVALPIYDTKFRSTTVPTSTAPVNRPAAAGKSDQRFCPVTGAELGSMGTPILVTVQGKTVYVCCGGCVEKLKRNPEKYLGASTQLETTDLKRETNNSRSTSSGCGSLSCGQFGGHTRSPPCCR